MKVLSNVLNAVDSFVWGPVMLILLVGTGIFLTIRTKALCWRNLPYALKSVFGKDARKKTGDGDVSPFSALTTALAATIGTGNIVGVATAMVSGGPGALVWMWLSAAFGLSSKFSECMLAIKYREVNEKGEMSGGPMYTMKKGFKHKKVGAVMGWLFALLAVIASFGIGNLTQANSISSALNTSFHIPLWVTGIVITAAALVIVLGGIKSISKVSQVVVPAMAALYIIGGLIIIIGNIQNVPAGVAMIFKMAFSFKAIGGGMCGSLVASMMQAMRFGVARGVFSNEAGMGSAAITAAAATTTDPVRQGYINMTGTFWDTIVVCTITGLCIASSGVLGSTELAATGTYEYAAESSQVSIVLGEGNDQTSNTYQVSLTADEDGTTMLLLDNAAEDGDDLTLYLKDSDSSAAVAAESEDPFDGYTWLDSSKNEYVFENGSVSYHKVVVGAALTIKAFESVLGTPGGWFVSIALVPFAFSTILGWEYHGEKAFEYLFKTHKYNMIYRIIFSLFVFLGATTTLSIAWNFSDLANALMAVPNLICLLVLSGTVAKEMERYQGVIKEEKRAKKAAKKK